MFEHSVKVPRHYKVASNILKKVSTEGGSVKSLLYDEKLRHFRTNVLFALISEAIKHGADIDNIFENCKILQNEPRLDPWLAKILTAELLYGKKNLPGKSKPEQTIFSYKDQFENYQSEHQVDVTPEVVCKPRYVRINTILLTTSDAIRAFQDEGYRFVRCTSGSYDDYLEQIQNLNEYDFTQDYHVKTVFVFPSGTKLYEHELYMENKIILQNKATAMAVHILAPPPGSIIMDMCAAPGMKTTQLAAYLRNNGKIYAVERNEKRFQTLCDFVAKTESHCVQTIHKDCLEIKRGEYDDVEYIILDPSCSGSGMDISVHNYIDESRLAKLTSLQEKFLKHAMNAFPNVKRIVYSTCSIFPEENERVITNVVKTSRSKWRVQDVKELLKGQWNNFGSAMYGSMGTRCMYAKPDTDFTTGFFLAVLDRDQKQLEKHLNKDIDVNQEKCKNKKKSREKSMELIDEISTENNEYKDEAINNNIYEEDKNDTSVVLKSKNKKHKKSHETIEANVNINKEDTEELKSFNKNKRGNEDLSKLVDNIHELVLDGTENETIPKKKKKKNDKNKYEVGDCNIDIEDILNVINEDQEKIQNKKKRKKDSEFSSTEDTQCDNVHKSTGKKKLKSETIIEIDSQVHSNYTDMEPLKKKKKKKSNEDSRE